MDEELAFRIIFWIHLLVIIVFNRILPALRARKAGTKLTPDRESIANEGVPWFVFRVVAGLLLAAVIVIYSGFPAINARLQLPLPGSLRWAGVVLASLSLVLWCQAQAVLSRNWSANLKIQAGHALIETGPYRRMRHPIYTAMIFWSAGLALFTANLFFAAFAISVILWTPPRIAKEEQMMLDRFGDAYRSYMKRAGRYLPRVSRK